MIVHWQGDDGVTKSVNTETATRAELGEASVALFMANSCHLGKDHDMFERIFVGVLTPDDGSEIDRPEAIDVLVDVIAYLLEEDTMQPASAIDFKVAAIAQKLSEQAHRINLARPRSRFLRPV